MDTLPLHPKLVHLPIALALLMPILSAGLLLAWIRDLLPRRTWMVAVVLQAILVVSSVAAMRSGEAEEDVVEKVVAESAIEAHEEAAEAFTWTTAGVLVLFVAGAALPATAARGAATAATVATLLVLFLGYRTGQAGGALVYEHGAAAAYAKAPVAAGGAAQVAQREAEDEDDD
ncbi:MAG: DUF2231 domain-containing protein [Candidatus Binatia bacterium]